MDGNIVATVTTKDHVEQQRIIGGKPVGKQKKEIDARNANQSNISFAQEMATIDPRKRLLLLTLLGIFVGLILAGLVVLD